MLKVAGIVIVVLVALLGVTGALLKSAWEDVGKLEIALELQQEETRKANETITSLKVESAEMAIRNEQLTGRLADTEVKYARQIQDIRNTLTSTIAAAEREPNRYGRAATYLFRRSLRSVCRASGGTTEACRIVIPESPKADSGNSPQSGPEAVIQPPG